MAGAAGFWSYVQADDAADAGGVLALANAIRQEYEMVTATKLDLFVDRTELEWGNEWRKRIDEAIAGTTFFIPIVTPRYFQSDECRRELIQFTTKARNLGLEDLLLPVHYVDVPELDEGEPEDEAVRLVKRTQWIDWRAHRLSDAGDAGVRAAVHDMAERLADISLRVAQIPDKVSTFRPDEPDGRQPDNGGPGLMDRLAAGEVAIPKMGDALQGLGSAMNQVGDLMNEATAEVEAVDARGGGFAGRLRIARDLARRLEPLALTIEELGREYGAALVDADPAMDALLGMIEQRLLEGGAPLTEEEKGDTRELLENTLEMARNSEEAMGVLKEFLSGLEGIGDLSRDIRAPAVRMRRGLQGLVDGQAVIDEWARRARDLRVQLNGGPHHES